MGQPSLACRPTLCSSVLCRDHNVLTVDLARHIHPRAVLDGTSDQKKHHTTLQSCHRCHAYLDNEVAVDTCNVFGYRATIYTLKLHRGLVPPSIDFAEHVRPGRDLTVTTRNQQAEVIRSLFDLTGLLSVNIDLVRTYIQVRTSRSRLGTGWLKTYEHFLA